MLNKYYKYILHKFYFKRNIYVFILSKNAKMRMNNKNEENTSANLMKSATGSEPEDSTKIIGVKIVESLKHFARSNVGEIMYSFPS